MRFISIEQNAFFQEVVPGRSRQVQLQTTTSKLSSSSPACPAGRRTEH